jgi:hypothetical protein
MLPFLISEPNSPHPLQKYTWQLVNQLRIWHNLWIQYFFCFTIQNRKKKPNKMIHNLFYFNLSLFLASSDLRCSNKVSSNANSTVSLWNMGKLHTTQCIATRTSKSTGTKSNHLQFFLHKGNNSFNTPFSSITAVKYYVPLWHGRGKPSLSIEINS